MDVTLTPEMQQFVEDKVKSGKYGSPSEVVNRLLSQVKQQEAPPSDDVEELRAEVDIGIDDAQNGRFVEFTADDVIAERRAALAAKQVRGANRTGG